MNAPPTESWEELWQKVRSFQAQLVRYKRIHVNKADLKEEAKEIVQFYFRRARPDVLSLGISEEEVAAVDQAMQDLLRLSQGRNLQKSYIRLLRSLTPSRTSLSVLRERRLSELITRSTTVTTQTLSATEQKIIDTLKSMLPSAALSYEQACRDIVSKDRCSLRGTAVELRETLREVLDHLAPNHEVTNAPGFKPEEGQKGPTMKQKARFILKLRGQSKTAIKSPSDTTSLIEERTASLVRSTYERGSISTHVDTARAEVSQLKMYVDTVLAELLEIHGTR